MFDNIYWLKKHGKNRSILDVQKLICSFIVDGHPVDQLRNNLSPSVTMVKNFCFLSQPNNEVSVSPAQHYLDNNVLSHN